ncbi:Mor transcription activator family protein [Aeromonas veronii]|uniref:Mor transcription activator family protein n=1 Tax=Aeromonas veronii TaxID=654 RepID=UPI0035BADCB2
MPKCRCSKFNRKKKQSTRTTGIKYCDALASNRIERSGYSTEILTCFHVRKLALRDRASLDEFNGRNIDQLARKHGLSVPLIYSVVVE